MKKRISLLLAVALMMGVFAGCAQEQPDLELSDPPPTTDPGTTEPGTTDPGTTEPEQPEATTPLPEGEGALTYAVSADISTLNPHTYSMSRDADAMSLISIKLYESTLGEGDKFIHRGQVAAGEPTQLSDDQTEWEIKIREGLTWANGDPINADTVIYSYKMMIDPLLLNSRAAYFANGTIVIENATEYSLQGSDATVAWEDVGFQKIDDTTIHLKTVGPVTAYEIMTHFDFNSSLCMVHEATYEAAMAEDRMSTMYGTSADTFMSAGPFTLETWIPGASATYVKNPNYVHADDYWLNSITERVVTDSSTTLQLFLNGEIDYVSLSSDNFEQYMEDPRIISSAATSMRHISVNMGNTENPILQSENFRLALYYATDRDTVASISDSIPAWWIQPTMVIGDVATGTTYRELVEQQQPYEIPENNGYDPVKALEYFELALQESGTTTVDLLMYYSSDLAVYKTASEYLQKSWAEIFGADRFAIEIQGMPNSQMTATKKDWKNDPNSYELAWGAWSTSKTAPWNGYNVWRSTYTGKNEPYMNTELDELWIRANQSEERFDKQAQLEMAFRMEEIMLTEAAIIPIMESPNYYLKADRVQLPTSNNNYVVNVGFGWELAKIVE